MRLLKHVGMLTINKLAQRYEYLQMQQTSSRHIIQHCAASETIEEVVGNMAELADVTRGNSSVMKQGTETTCGDTVLVTGGAGFLGQHIVSLLQTKADHVKDIRILDLKPYANTLGHAENKTVTNFIGSVTDPTVTKHAFEGVDCVYHVAGKISYGTFPDMYGMHNVNVQGTRNVIKSCIDSNVKRLIFCSTVDVVIGYEDIVNGCEASTMTPAQFLFPGYPQTKYKAECLVLKANGNHCQNGSPLRTVSLRANVMYGELDPYYITNGLKTAKQSGNVLYQIGDGSAKFQPAYVGNTAWAFICADRALSKNCCVGGQFYFIPDDTPVQNTFELMRPFLEARGYILSRMKLPFRLVYYLLLAMEMVAKVLSPVLLLSLPAESYSVKYINMNIYFNNSKARKELGYSPLFTPALAKERSVKYYKALTL